MGVDIKSLPKPIRAFFNGIGQVVFIENVISGMIIFVSFWIAGLEMHGWDFGNWYSWRPVVFVAIGVNLANLVAYLMGADRDAITSGLFGFCPNLIAIGACTFTGSADAAGNWWSAWIMLVVGCILCVPLQIMINRFTGHFGLPGFTFPFIVMVWFFTAISFQTDLLAVGNTPGLKENVFLANGLTGDGGSWMTGFDWSTMGWDWGDMTSSHWGLFFINAFEEIYVIDGFIASLILILAYFWYNWQFALKACLATAFAIGMGLLFGANMGQMGLALYGYSSILTVGGLDTFCKSKINSGRYWFLFFLGLVLTSLINFAAQTVLGAFGMPSCTIAFVLAGWIILVVEHFMVEQAEKRAQSKAVATDGGGSGNDA
jgi:urea transporter